MVYMYLKIPLTDTVQSQYHNSFKEILSGTQTISVGLCATHKVEWTSGAESLDKR